MALAVRSFTRGHLMHWLFLLRQEQAQQAFQACRDIGGMQAS